MKQKKEPAFLISRSKYIKKQQSILKEKCNRINQLVGKNIIGNTYYFNDPSGANVNYYTTKCYKFGFYGIDWQMYDIDVKNNNRNPFDAETIKEIKKIDNEIKVFFKSLIAKNEYFDIVLINRLMEVIPSHFYKKD